MHEEELGLVCEPFNTVVDIEVTAKVEAAEALTELLHKDGLKHWRMAGKKKGEFHFEIDNPYTGNFLKAADKAVGSFSITRVRVKCLLTPEDDKHCVLLRDTVLRRFIASWANQAFEPSTVATMHQVGRGGSNDSHMWFSTEFDDLDYADCVAFQLNMNGPAVRSVARVKRFADLLKLDYDRIWASAGFMLSQTQVEAALDGYRGEIDAGELFIVHNFIRNASINYSDWPKQSLRKWIKQLPQIEEEEE